MKSTARTIRTKPAIRKKRAFQLIQGALVVLLAKVLVELLYQYRWYFPPNFDSSLFLMGRRHFFHGIYKAAFYTHIIGSPFALILSVFLLLTGKKRRILKAHRYAGRTQVLIMLLIVAPSGFIMSFQALSGPIAGSGFAMLSVATAWFGIAAIKTARARNFPSHERWAMRCFLLLLSPLFLRIASGVFIVTELESDFTYRLTAWGSWLVPLLAYELVNLRKRCDPAEN